MGLPIKGRYAGNEGPVYLQTNQKREIRNSFHTFFLFLNELVADEMWKSQETKSSLSEEKSCINTY